MYLGRAPGEFKKARSKTVSFGTLFNIPSINMDRTLVILCQFSLVLLFVRRYIRRKNELKTRKTEAEVLGLPYAERKEAARTVSLCRFAALRLHDRECFFR